MDTVNGRKRPLTSKATPNAICMRVCTPMTKNMGTVSSNGSQVIDMKATTLKTKDTDTAL